MYEDVLKTLLLPFDQGLLRWPDDDRAVLLMNGRPGPGVPARAMVQLYFRADPATLTREIVPEIPEGARFDVVLIHAGKQHDEARYDMARGLAHLNDGGILVCAGANDAGGRRIAADFTACGFMATQELSKNKCRVVWAVKNGHEMLDWMKSGAMQPVLDGRFVSRPGVFGWDKIDIGSALLTAHLPDNGLIGAGADFGCGYGFLARHILDHNRDVSALYCLDNDYRAIESCGENLKNDARVSYGWSDLTKPQDELPALDFIVMNPPFHEGKTAQYSIGTDFIKTAAASLRKGGELWMVANAHLPYETVLDICFSKVVKVNEEKGFKVFRAEK